MAWVAKRLSEVVRVTGEPIQYRLVGSDPAETRTKDALRDLFSGDGTIYLITGFFTYNGYRAIRDDIVAFLRRSRSNHLVVVVGPSSDQFSARIARDLWRVDENDQVAIHKSPRGLHAKLYLRTGPAPRVILGSANLTQVGFEYNTELGVDVRSTTPGHPEIEAFVTWAEHLVSDSPPLRNRDLYFPVQFANAVRNWTNKGRLLPRRYVLQRIAPVIVLVVGLGLLFRLV